jgi:LCP family protein required for cell wall assembly
MLASVAVFVLLVYATKSNLGVLIAAVGGGITGATTWWLMNSGESRDRLAKVLTNLPELGGIPTDRSSPAPALGTGATAAAYLDVVRALEASTTGSVLLFTSPAPGMGATTVALNTAIAATRAGRRVLIVDGDSSGHGISRFLSTGSEPGLTDLAAGETAVLQTARLLSIGPSGKLPIIPAGGSDVDPAALSDVTIADAIDQVAGSADLVIIDAPPIGWSDATPHLAAHADGSILVVTDTADSVVVVEAGERLRDVGAPVLGYVTNRVERSITPFATIWKPFTARFVLSTLVLTVAFSLFTGAQLWASWASIERQEFGLAEASDLLTDATTSTTAAEGAEPAVTVPPTTTTTTQPPPEEPFETMLIIGGDDDSGASDVILYLVLPTNDADPFMVSFPRDLSVEKPCTGNKGRINALSHGCQEKDINGPTLLSVQVSNMTGINVDHFAEFTFDGFVEIIDAVGGVEICVGDYPVRDAGEAQLDLPAGCTNATGEQALSWVRSRKIQQFRDGEWRRMPGTSDLMRNTHQQDVIITLAKKLKNFDSPQQLTQVVASVADAFTLSETLSLTDAISLAWSMRDLDIETINRVKIPVELGRSPSNQSILRAQADLKDLIADLYGDTLPPETER